MVLKELGFSNCVLHSMTRQQLRLEAMALFKSHKVRILVATDLASRGLDIPTVDMVINHSVPTRPQDYIHRVGRTARAGELRIGICGFQCDRHCFMWTVNVIWTGADLRLFKLTFYIAL